MIQKLQCCNENIFIFTIKSPLSSTLINVFKNKIISKSTLNVSFSSTVRLFFTDLGMENTQSIRLQEVEHLGKDINKQKC